MNNRGRNPRRQTWRAEIMDHARESTEKNGELLRLLAEPEAKSDVEAPADPAAGLVSPERPEALKKRFNRG